MAVQLIVEEGALLVETEMVDIMHLAFEVCDPDIVVDAP